MNTSIKMWFITCLAFAISGISLAQSSKSWTIQIDLIPYTEDSSILNVTARNIGDIPIFTPSEMAIRFSTFTENGYLVFDISNPIIADNGRLGGLLLESEVEMNFEKINPQQILTFDRFIKRNPSCIDSISVMLKYYIPRTENAGQFETKEQTLKIHRNHIFNVFSEHSTNFSTHPNSTINFEPETLYLGIENPTPTKLIKLKNDKNLDPLFEGGIVSFNGKNAQSVMSISTQPHNNYCCLKVLSFNKISKDTTYIGAYKVRSAPKPELVHFYGIDSIINFQKFENIILKAYRFDLPFPSDTVEVFRFTAFVLDPSGTKTYSKVINGNQFADDLVQIINQATVGSVLIIDNIKGHCTSGSCNVKSKIIELRP
jgi:hypothetical protein